MLQSFYEPRPTMRSIITRW